MTKLKSKLNKTEEVATDQFSVLNSGQDVANFLEIPYGQLLYLLYKRPDEKKYISFYIPKKTKGRRLISKPMKGIDILQQKLKPHLESFYRTKAPVHGFVKGKSIVSNASAHKKHKYVLNVDLADFYGTINYGRVRGVFLATPFKFGEKAASVLAQLICFQNKLPQGACTSPVVSNLVASNLDKKLVALAKRYHCQYTRYADDITISCNKKTFPHSLATYEGNNPITGETIIGKLLEDTIDSAGFRVNHSKVRLQIPFIRQSVTGLTVNEFPNVNRDFIRSVRAMLHDWKTNGLLTAEKNYISKHPQKKIDIPEDKLDGTYFLKVFYGKLSFIKMVRADKENNDSVVSNFALKAGELDPNPPKYIKEIMKKSESFDIFIGHASEDKDEVARPLFEECEKQGIIAFIDEIHISWGDSLTEKINHALGKSKYFLAVLSEKSIKKSWPRKELNSAVAREISGEQKVLPLIVGDHKKIFAEFPLLADKLFIQWEGDVEQIVDEIKKLKAKHPTK
ncbi:MAG: TIR domain-containing anti-phage reverse transcriptase [Candidatus Electrothrix sp. GW3-4]|uniref:TIR domain-containing anti-phage reverse transcriptase n=1 Tax=Candidatus Electrothrix sp. GW3-4 TaxID=3126740 RepID=UPI0030CB43DE